ncbi:hypothetical protein STAN_7106 [Streptomyces sp. CBMAI 2042]|nr:hypothetical protein STAN_7106 [Streptomyces sp. CBMAI 2042]
MCATCLTADRRLRVSRIYRALPVERAGPEPPSRSPHGRGNLRPWTNTASRQSWMLTSARAESTGRPRPGRGCTPFHLRSRGEHAKNPRFNAPKNGSPPLARRAQTPAAAPGARVRLTSARAESTATAATVGAVGAAHLRSRGEHLPAANTHGGYYGSPPLARRARDHHPGTAGHGRLTSARAESTPGTPTS